MITLGIDPGSYTAIAVIHDRIIYTVGNINLNKVKDNKVLYYYTELGRVLDEYTPEVVYCEEPFMPPKFPQAGKSMNKKLAIIELLCQQRGIPYKFINPSVVKKTITGRGRAEKDELARAVQEIVDNPELIGDLLIKKKFDETDAVAIALAGFMTGGI